MATSSQRRPLQPTSRLFHDVEVKVALGTLRCTFVGCSFTGLWDGNFSAGHGRHRVEGNDFRELRGADFRDGVDWSKNQFDHGGSQLILTAAAARSPVVRDVALTHPDLAMMVTSLRGEGPIAIGQDWVLLYRTEFESGQWDELRASITS